MLRAASIVLVSVYMAGVGLWFVATGRVDGRPLRRYLKSLFRRRHAADLTGIAPEQGHCYVADLGVSLYSDDMGFSRLRVFEDGRPLGPGHCGHDAIRAKGGGRYSHWGRAVYFSTSDNSDPRSNGRRYSVREV